MNWFLYFNYHLAVMWLLAFCVSSGAMGRLQRVIVAFLWNALSRIMIILMFGIPSICITVN